MNTTIKAVTIGGAVTALVVTFILRLEAMVSAPVVLVILKILGVIVLSLAFSWSVTEAIKRLVLWPWLAHKYPNKAAAAGGHLQPLMDLPARWYIYGSAVATAFLAHFSYAALVEYPGGWLTAFYVSVIVAGGSPWAWRVMFIIVLPKLIQLFRGNHVK